MDEIGEQPSVLQGLLDRAQTTVAHVADVIRKRDIHYVYLAARGSSEHAGIYGQYLLGAFNQLPVALAAPSLFTIYQRPPQLKHALVVGVSQSGQSPDIVSVLDEARRQNALTLAVTNNTDSPLAQAADLTLDIQSGIEQSVAATKTYTAQLFVFAMLSVALANDQKRAAELQRVPSAVQEALQLHDAAAAAAAHFRAISHCVVLGRGYHFASALEWSLKLKELSYVVAERYSTAEFQHGPISVVERGFPVLAVAPAGADMAATLELLRHLRDARGADVLALSDDDTTLAAASLGLKLPAYVADWLMPIVSIVPAQVFSNHLAIARGFDPNAPRGLSKVTLTR
jgi:glucosamine--fructose-6-phosphate aminotransferase (isomerizing)